MDDELKECERKQTRENQERMNQEDLKVQRQHAKALKTALTETHILRVMCNTHTHTHRCLFPL